MYLKILEKLIVALKTNSLNMLPFCPYDFDMKIQQIQKWGLVVQLTIFFCIFVTLASYHAIAGDSDEEGYVLALVGEVFVVSRDGVTRDLKVKDSVRAGDLIVTENKSRIRIVFPDKTVVSLGEGSRVRLNDYRWNDKSRQGRFQLSISEGFFRIIGGKLTKNSPQTFITETPAATIGIRGSSYAGSVQDARLKVFLSSGRGIDVYNRSGSVALLAAGRGTTVASEMTAPSPGRDFSREEMEMLFQQTEVGGEQENNSATSKVSGTVINEVSVQNSVNIATGRGNRSTMGSVVVKGAQVTGTIVNKADISDAANISSGSDNEAVMGSIIIE